MRQEALEWWTSLNKKQKNSSINKWKQITSDSRKKWEHSLIHASDCTIEFIFTELTANDLLTKEIDNSQSAADDYLDYLDSRY